ncbi:MAG TPA: hypothetical protein V6C76_10145 [Drouetiella sp.]
MNIKVALSIAVTAMLSYLTQPSNAGQDIVGETGQMFMEETTPPPPAASQQKRVPIDLSNVGVPVDERGRIVPLIDRSSPDGVRRNFSNFESYSTPALISLPPNIYLQPYNMYSNVPYGAAGYPPPYGRYGIPYGSPYGYGNGMGFNLGKFRVNLGTPGYGTYGGSPWGYGGNPYGYASPWGFGANRFGYASPWNYGNPYQFGMANQWGNPYGNIGNFGMNPFVAQSAPFGSPVFSNPYAYGAPGGIFGPSPFPIYSSPLLGSSLFNGNVGGLGLSLFTPPKVEFQTSGTITPITPNLDTTDLP